MSALLPTLGDWIAAATWIALIALWRHGARAPTSKLDP